MIVNGKKIDYSGNVIQKVTFIDEEINIPDDNFRRCLNTALGKSANNPITKTQLTGMYKDLDCSMEGITNIEGAQYLTGVRSIELYDNNISNIEPLSELKFLTDLDLSDNQISNIEPLSELDLLRYLNLASNQIYNIESLKNLGRIEEFKLHNQEIELESIEIDKRVYSFNEIVVSLNGSILEYEDPNIYTFSANETRKVENYWDERITLGRESGTYSGVIKQNVTYKGIDGEVNIPDNNFRACLNKENSIVNIEPLKNLSNLTDVELYDQEIQLEDIVIDNSKYSLNEIIISIDGSTIEYDNLNEYNFNENETKEIENSWNKEFELSSNSMRMSYSGTIRQVVSYRSGVYEVVNIPDKNFKKCLNMALGQYDYPDAPIAKSQLSSLSEQVTCSFSNITDIEGAQYLTNINTLFLAGNNISNIDALKDLTNLTSIHLGHNNITDIETLKSLTSLEYLSLNYNNISNLDTLKNLTNLKQLYLDNNSIDSVVALSGLINLEELNLDYNSITNIEPLKNLDKLVYVGLYEQKIQLEDVVINSSSYSFSDKIVSIDGSIIEYTDSNEYIFNEGETKEVSNAWNTEVKIGNASVAYNGTITQKVTSEK